MPIYEYRCGACGHELEALQKLADSPLKECPACGQGRLTKLVSAAGFRLKGSGWYATDFKNRAKPAEKNNGAKGNAEPAAAAATDTGTTPASGGESKAENTSSSGGESKAENTSASGGESKAESTPASRGGGSLCH